VISLYILIKEIPKNGPSRDFVDIQSGPEFMVDSTDTTWSQHKIKISMND